MNYNQLVSYQRDFFRILNQMTDRMLFLEFYSDSITKYFIECMIPHHRAAIFMCENLLRYTKNQSLIQIAQNIIRTQTKGITQMQTIFETTMFQNPSENRITYQKEYYRIAISMIRRMKYSRDYNQVDLNFISQMIPHHEGAIEMCEHLLSYPIDTRLAQVARDIIQEQQNGIQRLKQVFIHIRETTSVS